MKNRDNTNTESQTETINILFIPFFIAKPHLTCD